MFKYTKNAFAARGLSDPAEIEVPLQSAIDSAPLLDEDRSLRMEIKGKEKRGLEGKEKDHDCEKTPHEINFWLRDLGYVPKLIITTVLRVTVFKIRKKYCYRPPTVSTLYIV